jgi:hypothetical protein
MNIKETIESTPELLALMPDAKAIAEAMSINRTKLGTVSRAWLATWSAGNGMRAVIQDTANTEGHPLRSIALATLDVLSGAADGIDFSVPENVASVQAWVTVGLMPQSEADALFALGTYPDPISERDVVLAITNDDGSSKL